MIQKNQQLMCLEVYKVFFKSMIQEEGVRFSQVTRKMGRQAVEEEPRAGISKETKRNIGLG